MLPTSSQRPATTKPVSARAFARRRGAAAVELAVMLPFLAFAFVAAADFGRAFYASVVVQNCARNGAVYGSADAAAARNSAAIQTEAVKDGSNIGVTTQMVSSAVSTDANNVPTAVDVTVAYQFNTLTRYPWVPSRLTISRTVRIAVVPATPAQYY